LGFSSPKFFFSTYFLGHRTSHFRLDAGSSDYFQIARSISAARDVQGHELVAHGLAVSIRVLIRLSANLPRVQIFALAFCMCY
jgi:hypothetical protein